MSATFCAIPGSPRRELRLSFWAPACWRAPAVAPNGIGRVRSTVAAVRIRVWAPEAVKRQCACALEASS